MLDCRSITTTRTHDCFFELRSGHWVYFACYVHCCCAAIFRNVLGRSGGVSVNSQHLTMGSQQPRVRLKKRNGVSFCVWPLLMVEVLTISRIVLLNLVGQCGPLLGTRVFPQRQKPRYIEGQSICAAFMFFNALLALSLRTLLIWENKKLDKKYGKLNKSTKSEGIAEVETNIGQENYGRSFRYIL